MSALRANDVTMQAQPGRVDDREHLSAAPPPAKAARARYTRFFPERQLYLHDRLTAPEFVAFHRLAMEFVQRDGVLPANDKHLAAAVKMTPKAWATFRDKLLVLGLGHIEHGHWIDDDQRTNLQMQANASARGQAAAAKRWAAQRDGEA